MVKKFNYNQQAFLVLVRAGLWEQEVGLVPCDEIDFQEILRYAEEQSVIGLVAAGMERITDINVPQKHSLVFIGKALQIERQNEAMNYFIVALVRKLRNAGIYALLLKGQGVAQCYEKPLWRSCGDVDLLLSETNYEKAKVFLKPLASSVEKEGILNKHLGLTINSWVVELHGSLRTGLSPRIDRQLNEIKRNTYNWGSVRSWDNSGVSVFMLDVNNDIVYVFVHFLSHFYKGGIGLRQMCDWCRLLWTYREQIDLGLLESRLQSMNLMSEWKSFGAFVVDYLGMPLEAMPLYPSGKKWKRKAEKICVFVLNVGNFGHNRDVSYYNTKPYIVRKTISLGRRCTDFIQHSRIFPFNSIRFFPTIMFNGLRSAARGE